MKNPLLLISIVSGLILLQFSASAQDSIEKKKGKIPTGFSFGALPIVSFDADLGFQYGGLVNLYDYGDGSIYPQYKHMLKLEVSRYTKGSGINDLFYDSKYLLPKNIRITADLGYLTDKLFDFYGYNGYQSVYNSTYVDKADTGYVTSIFYRYERKLFRFTADLQGKLYGDHLRWVGGIAFISVKAGAVDTASLNQKKDEGDKLPYTSNLYDLYVDWNLLSPAERDGGTANFLKMGLVYDSRDNEASPTKGIWSEALLVYSPGFLFNSEFSFTKLVLIHRQYFTVLHNKLTFAYRLGYQSTIGGGHAPYYFESYLVSSFSASTKPDGLGGAKTLRGILRNRVVGDGVAYGNFELRWKFLQTHVGKANLYFGLDGFFDVGKVVRPFGIDENKIPEQDRNVYFNFTYQNDKLHPSAGGGLRVALNENFILAVDYGFALNKQDGLKGLYISVGNLF